VIATIRYYLGFLDAPVQVRHSKNMHRHPEGGLSVSSIASHFQTSAWREELPFVDASQFHAKHHHDDDQLSSRHAVTASHTQSLHRVRGLQ
jgi:hypothetical protein